MARYPMRSSWRAYRPGSRKSGGTLRSRGCYPVGAGAHPRSRPGFAAYRLRHHRLRARHADASSRRAASPPRAVRSPIACASFTRAWPNSSPQHAPQRDRRRARVPLEERRQRAQARARRAARRSPPCPRRSGCTNTRRAPSSSRWSAWVARRKPRSRTWSNNCCASICKLAADAADALAVAICHAQLQQPHRAGSIESTHDRIRARQTRGEGAAASDGGRGWRGLRHRSAHVDVLHAARRWAATCACSRIWWCARTRTSSTASARRKSARCSATCSRCRRSGRRSRWPFSRA